MAERERVGIPEASKLIAEWFTVEATGVDAVEPEATTEAIDVDPDAEDEENAINTVLHFPGLKSLDVEHSYLKELDLEAEAVEHFESGFCRKGLMKDRVAIAIHNAEGELLGYAGLDPKAGVYLHPENLSPLLTVYNLHRQERGSALVLVAEYLDVWRLHAVGIENAVALHDGRVCQHQIQTLQDFQPDRLLLLQTSQALNLRHVADALLDSFFTRLKVMPPGVNLSRLSPAEILG